MTRRDLLVSGAISGNMTGFGPSAAFKKPTTITFTDPGIVIDCVTGNVTYPDTLNMNEASKAFWQAVRDNFPGMDWKW